MTDCYSSFIRHEKIFEISSASLYKLNLRKISYTFHFLLAFINYLATIDELLRCSSCVPVTEESVSYQMNIEINFMQYLCSPNSAYISNQQLCAIDKSSNVLPVSISPQQWSKSPQQWRNRSPLVCDLISPLEATDLVLLFVAKTARCSEQAPFRVDGATGPGILNQYLCSVSRANPPDRITT